MSNRTKYSAAQKLKMLATMFVDYDNHATNTSASFKDGYPTQSSLSAWSRKLQSKNLFKRPGQMLPHAKFFNPDKATSTQKLSILNFLYTGGNPEQVQKNFKVTHDHIMSWAKSFPDFLRPSNYPTSVSRPTPPAVMETLSEVCPPSDLSKPNSEVITALALLEEAVRRENQTASMKSMKAEMENLRKENAKLKADLAKFVKLSNGIMDLSNHMNVTI
jgi:hypothetical protein